LFWIILLSRVPKSYAAPEMDSIRIFSLELGCALATLVLSFSLGAAPFGVKGAGFSNDLGYQFK
jgi:hypothetical protein